MASERAILPRGEADLAGPAFEDLIDLEFEAYCAREGDESVTLDEVRRATASIPGSMAEAIVQDERAERP